MRTIIASLTLLFAAGHASSQTEKINLRTLAVGNARFEELWTLSADKAVPLPFSNNQPSAPLKADKANPLRIFKGPLDENGKPTDPSPALVDLPASASILLLGRIEDGKPTFLAVADSFATVKSDDWLVINLTKKPLTIQFGEAAKSPVVEANSQLTVKCTAPVGEGSATTVSSQQADGGWKAVYSSYLPIYPDQRGLIIASQIGERIKVDYIADPVGGKPAPKKR